MRHTLSSLVALAASLLVSPTVFAAPGGSNSTPITITDNANASLYPSTINIAGPLNISNMIVRLIGVDHHRLSDLTVLVVSPTGRKIQLMANAPGSSSTGQDLFFSEEGTAFNGDPVNEFSNYRPTAIPGPVAMPAPAPGLPYETSFASVINDDAGGTWSLYVRDNVAGQAGVIAGGWAIGFGGTGATSRNSEFVYQGIAKDAGVPINGVRDIKLTFFQSPIATTPASLVGSATAFGVNVQNGLFAALFTPPDVVANNDHQLWIEVGVKLPADSVFTTLSPRQRLTSAPFAALTNRAFTADSAFFASSVDWSGITSIPANVLNAFSPWQSVNGNSINTSTTGNVLIGTSTGSSKLTVNGFIESTSGGMKFPDGSTQTTAAPASPVVASSATAINFASIAAGAEGIGVITISGASMLTTDVAVISPQADLPADFAISWARVSSATQVRFAVRNHGTAAVDPASITFNLRVIR